MSLCKLLFFHRSRFFGTGESAPIFTHFELQHWLDMSTTCFVLSVMISLAVFVFSPKPNQTSIRCATSDQCKTIKPEQDPAGEQLSPRKKKVGVQPRKTRGGNRAASSAPELK
jgi:hypothetical protein